MNPTAAPVASTASPDLAGHRRSVLARPGLWVLLWGGYSLLALGYLGYQSAWLGAVCGVAP